MISCIMENDAIFKSSADIRWRQFKSMLKPSTDTKKSESPRFGPCGTPDVEIYVCTPIFNKLLSAQ